MGNPASYRRPAFTCRPWIRDKLYDTYALRTILHCDAYVFAFGGREHLSIEWREGGLTLVALDTWLIEDDGLTPVWDITRHHGTALYWTRANNATMARVHGTVLAQVAHMLDLGQGRWARVVTQCHYVRTRMTDCEIPADRNHYTPPRNAPSPLTTFSTPPRKRGRPRKNTLPDWL